MTTALLHADARADAHGRARPDLLERRLRRFHPRFRPQVRALAERHSRLKDLALSFPALLLALAVPRAGYDRERVCALVVEGAPLRNLAPLAHVPIWLRRLEPQAFTRPLPMLPDGAFVSRQVVNHIPRSPKMVSDWLGAIAQAAKIADEAVAMWTAREWQQKPKRVRAHTVRWMHLWAWYARHVPDDPCRVNAAWTPSLSFSTAQRLAGEWRTNLLLYLKLGDKPLADMWFKPGVVGGFEIVPLATYSDVVAEALAMKHCVRWYGSDLDENVCRLWSIRRNGARVATFEVSQAGESPFAHIAQVKLADDKRAPEGIWKVAQAWLCAQQRTCLGVYERPRNVMPAQAQAWRRMWRPY